MYLRLVCRILEEDGLKRLVGCATQIARPQAVSLFPCMARKAGENTYNIDTQTFNAHTKYEHKENTISNLCNGNSDGGHSFSPDKEDGGDGAVGEHDEGGGGL